MPDYIFWIYRAIPLGSNVHVLIICAPSRPREKYQQKLLFSNIFALHRDRTRGNQPEYTVHCSQPHVCAMCIYISISIFGNIFPCRNQMIMPLAFTRQEAISAHAVYNLQVSVLKTSRPFGCLDYLPPRNAHGESFTQSLCPITYLYLR